MCQQLIKLIKRLLWKQKDMYSLKFSNMVFNDSN